MIEREFVGGREDKLARRPVGKRGYSRFEPGPALPDNNHPPTQRVLRRMLPVVSSTGYYY